MASFTRIMLLPNPVRQGAASQQRGMALIMALVILMILTILGVTAMTTSSLEEKMAGNIQEQTRAFQAAESGVSEAMVQILNSTTGVIPATTKNFSGGRSAARYRVNSLGLVTGGSGGRSGNRDDDTGFNSGAWSHFEISSVGTTTTNARTMVEQGVKKKSPPPGGGS